MYCYYFRASVILEEFLSVPGQVLLCLFDYPRKFADDFDGPLSISPDGRGARYAAHKTGGGDFSGWPFSDPAGD